MSDSVHSGSGSGSGTGTVTSVDFDRLREIRASSPEKIAEALSARSRRPLLAGDRRLFIVAADHPARGALGVRNDSMAMADRYDLIQRLATALENPGVDGVLATPDIIDDLAILGLLDNKVVVGSMNRGGLRGAAFEMDDRYTGYDIDSVVAAGLDFAKLLVRVNLTDRGTVETLERTAHVVTQSAAAKLPIMLEPFMSEWREGKIVNNLSADAVILSMAIASGLGASSAYSWLKLPVVPDMARVMAASTLPTLILGGDASGDPEETFLAWAEALGLPGVHGLVAGRTLLYPADNDVSSAVETAAALVHSRTHVSS